MENRAAAWAETSACDCALLPRRFVPAAPVEPGRRQLFGFGRFGFRDFSRDDACAALVAVISVGPVKQYGDAVAKANQKDQMNEQPKQPGGVSGEVNPFKPGNSSGTSNRRHRTFVQILKQRVRRFR